MGEMTPDQLAYKLMGTLSSLVELAIGTNKASPSISFGKLKISSKINSVLYGRLNSDCQTICLFDYGQIDSSRVLKPSSSLTKVVLIKIYYKTFNGVSAPEATSFFFQHHHPLLGAI